MEWVLGVELRYKTQIGPGLRLYHAQALVVHEGTVIGAGCTLRQCTTIGNKTLADGSQSACPVLGDGVDVGANAVVLGAIRVGDGAVIGAQSIVGANALVTQGMVVPPGSMVLGSPAKVVRQLTAAERESLRGWAEKYVENAAYCLEHGINVGRPLAT